nr:hypothetical protein Iba_chr04fCG1470 [Ipomoea batatas]GMD73878.1 hypothetical protein Iba_scaffold50905CG0010 [Ipomoea batatas]
MTRTKIYRRLRPSERDLGPRQGIQRGLLGPGDWTRERDPVPGLRGRPRTITVPPQSSSPGLKLQPDLA